MSSPGKAPPRKEGLKAWQFWAGLLVLLALMVGGYALLSDQTSWEMAGHKRYVPYGEYLAAGGGRKLRVWCMGVGGPPILLEASGLGGADEYADLLPQLGRYTRACAYDRAGMGYSVPREKAPSFGDYLADLEVVATHLGPPPHVLVGASYGGLLVQARARAHPEKVAGLVLLDAVVPETFEAMAGPWSALDRALFQASVAAPLGVLRRANPLQLADEKQAWLTYRGSTWTAARQLVATRDEASGLFKTLPPLRGDLPLRLLRHTRVGDLLGPSHSPAEHEALEPKWKAAQERAAAQSSMGKVVPIEGAGHLLVRDASEAVADAVLEVHRQVAPKPTAGAGQPSDAPGSAPPSDLLRGVFPRPPPPLGVPLPGAPPHGASPHPGSPPGGASHEGHQH